MTNPVGIIGLRTRKKITKKKERKKKKRVRKRL
jgi:hypothetical protein